MINWIKKHFSQILTSIMLLAIGGASGFIFDLYNTVQSHSLELKQYKEENNAQWSILEEFDDLKLTVMTLSLVQEGIFLPLFINKLKNDQEVEVPSFLPEIMPDKIPSLKPFRNESRTTEEFREQKMMEHNR